jgi:hypothetical protein
MEFQGRHSSTTFAKKAKKRLDKILQEPFIYTVYAKYTPGVDVESLKNLILECPPIVQFLWIEDFNYDSVCHRPLSVVAYDSGALFVIRLVDLWRFTLFSFQPLVYYLLFVIQIFHLLVRLHHYL